MTIVLISVAIAFNISVGFVLGAWWCGLKQDAKRFDYE